MDLLPSPPSAPPETPDETIRRLTAELREARDQQAAATEILDIINRSPGDLAPVFDAILQKALRLCDASFGVVWVYDGKLFNAATVNASPEFADYLRNNPQKALPASDLGRLLRGENVIHREDYAIGSFPNLELNRAFRELGRGRSGLLVALRRDDELLGAIRIFHREVRPFSQKQIVLLENFAAQAVIAMENARLINETREALEQQTATAEVLQVINSSPGDLAPVFDAMLEKAMRLCEAAFGGLWTFERDSFVAVAMKNVPAACAQFFAETTAIPGPGTAPYRFLHGERLAHEIDLASSEAYKAGDPARRALVDLGGARTALQIALRKDDQVLGIITVYRQEVRPFSDKQIALLENFAAQAVIAMENARLITETREALEQQTATAEVLQVINSSPGDLAPVFDAMLEKAMRLCEASFGSLMTYNSELFTLVAHRGHEDFDRWIHEAGADHFRAEPGMVTARIVEGERVVHIADISDSRAYPGGSPVQRGLVERGGYRTLLGVALHKDTRLLGVIFIARQEVRPFTDKQIALLQNFAAQAVIAIENARLLTETREALEKQTATAEILRVISGSPTDLQPTFDAIVANATILSGAEAGGVFRFDGSLIHFVAQHGYEPDVLEAIQRDFPTRPGRHSTTARAILTREVAHIPDAAADPEYALRAILQTGVHTMLSVPILQDGNPVGAITVTRRAVAPFSQAQIDLLKTFSDQAVIAIENVRLFNETREALEQQTATAEVLQVINSSPGDLAPVFDVILEKAHTLCAVAQGALELYDGDFFRAVATRGLSDTFVARIRQGYRGAENPVTRPLLNGARFNHITDLSEVDHPISRAAANIGGLRTSLSCRCAEMAPYSARLFPRGAKSARSPTSRSH
jgi:GAF domain-containing protein